MVYTSLAHGLNMFLNTTVRNKAVKQNGKK